MQADALAVEALARAGFDPNSFLLYVEQIPNASKRKENIRSRVYLLLQANYIVDESDFATVRQEVRPLTERQSALPTLSTLGPK